MSINSNINSIFQDRLYRGFKKSLELYNIDNLFLDERARSQVLETGKVIIVEGFWDVAKLVEAGIFNVVATMGAHLDENQLSEIDLIHKIITINKKNPIKEIEFLVFYDRDEKEKGKEAQERAITLLKDNNYQGSGFDWNIEFKSPTRGNINLPQNVNDPCDFSVEQLSWLRDNEII